jgi:hypothetical protein
VCARVSEFGEKWDDADGKTSISKGSRDKTMISVVLIGLIRQADGLMKEEGTSKKILRSICNEKRAVNQKKSGETNENMNQKNQKDRQIKDMQFLVF